MRSPASVLLAASILAFSTGALAFAQNLVADGGFASSLEAWHHDPNPDGTSAWSAVDANGSATSGSALLISTAATDGVLITLLEQCVPVAPGKSYILSHKAIFTAGEPATGSAESVVTWFGGPTCTNRVGANSIVTPKSGAPGWSATSDTFTAPAGAISAIVSVGVDKIEAGGSLTALVDDVSLAPVGVTDEEIRGQLAVVGSLSGNFGANFRTSLKILNPQGGVSLSGRLIFHPAGQPESASDPSMGYSLGPGQAFAWYDVVAAMGLSGLGSMDVTGDSGVTPVVVARIFDDAGAEGTTGFTEPPFGAFPASPPRPGPTIVNHLLLPDLDFFRYNVGVRILAAPVEVTVEVLSPAGAVVHTLTRTYTINTFQQTSADDFAGVALENGQNLRVTASPNYLILYGATVDNVTNDPSAQFTIPGGSVF
jgi:hypothetical protein